jgi:hypothetical protein
MSPLVPFPASLDEVTAPWMGRLLARRFPGVEVTALRAGQVIRATATKVEYQLEYGETAGPPPPPSLWLKCGFEIHASEFISHCGAEARFYRDIAPLLGDVNVPKTHGVLTDDATQNGLILFEDLNRRPVRFGNQNHPLDPRGVGRVLDLLADCHAALWRDPRLLTFPGFRPGGVIHSTRVVDIFMGFWEDAAPRPRFEHVPASLRDRERIAGAVHALLAADMADPVCVVHGDPHQANLFFDPDGAPGLMDWATVMPGHWAWDVSYLIGGSQSVEQRRALEKDQLAAYLARLRAHGVAAPDFARAWRDYVRHALWLFMTALCPVEMQPEDLCILNAERASAAITDLGSLQAILG